MNRRSLTILLLAEDPQVIQLLEEAVRELDENRYSRPWLSPSTLLFAYRIGEALDLIQSSAVDVVLLDAGLPGIELPETFDTLCAAAPASPIVLLGDASSELCAFDLLRQGAQDFLLTAELEPIPLARALRAAVCRHRLLSGLRGLALVDELTGLYTERGFFHLAARHGHLARQWQVPVGLFLIEPKLADGAGRSRRQEEDLILIRTAEFLHGSAEPFDLLARLAPRRFAWLLLLVGSKAKDDACSRFHAAQMLLTCPQAGSGALELRAGFALEAQPGNFCLDRLLEEAEASLLGRSSVAGALTGGKPLLSPVRK